MTALKTVLLFIFITLLAEAKAVNNILLCWSGPDHPQGTHDYKGFAEFYAKLLGEDSRFKTSIREGFPCEVDWSTNDLIILNLTHNEMTKAEQDNLDAYLKAGKSLIIIHQALTQRKTYAQWGERIGMSYCFSKDKNNSHWGSGKLDITVDSTHPILKGIPEEFSIREELYWNLLPSASGNTQILGTTKAPRNPSAFSNCPVFWTHTPSIGRQNKARVFCCVIGHNNSVTEGAFFKHLMTNASEWCLKHKH